MADDVGTMVFAMVELLAGLALIVRVIKQESVDAALDRAYRGSRRPTARGAGQAKLWRIGQIVVGLWLLGHGVFSLLGALGE